uniref:Uncharacterized protein n=1 Tax=Ralstonia pickettii (strain 12D) TaxID=428406 RepID=C6BQM1_RALP1
MFWGGLTVVHSQHASGVVAQGSKPFRTASLVGELFVRRSHVIIRHYHV